MNNQDLEVKSRQLRIELLELILENPETASVIVEEKIQELGLEYRTNWLAGLIILGDNKLSSPLSMEMEAMRDECKKWIDETEGINGFCEIYEGQLVLFISSNLDNIQLKHQFNNLQNNLRNTNHSDCTSSCIGRNKATRIVFG